LNNGTVHFGAIASGDDLNVETGNVLSNDVWQMVAITWDGSLTAANVKIYVDGALKPNSTAETDGTGVVVAATGAWALAGRAMDDARNYDGGIAHAAWFNKVLTAAEILSLYKAGIDTHRFHRRNRLLAL
jgi:hypothetical protein